MQQLYRQEEQHFSDGSFYERLESVRIHFYAKLESVRIGKCQNWKVSESESFRIGNCQNRKVSELECVRIGKCQNWNVSELLKIGKCLN